MKTMPELKAGDPVTLFQNLARGELILVRLKTVRPLDPGQIYTVAAEPQDVLLRLRNDQGEISIPLAPDHATSSFRYQKVTLQDGFHGEEKWMPLQEVARKTGIPEEALDAAVREGSFPGVQAGETWLVDREQAARRKWSQFAPAVLEELRRQAGERLTQAGRLDLLAVISAPAWWEDLLAEKGLRRAARSMADAGIRTVGDLATCIVVFGLYASDPESRPYFIFADGFNQSPNFAQFGPQSWKAVLDELEQRGFTWRDFYTNPHARTGE